MTTGMRTPAARTAIASSILPVKSAKAPRRSNAFGLDRTEPIGIGFDGGNDLDARPGPTRDLAKIGAQALGVELDLGVASKPLAHGVRKRPSCRPTMGGVRSEEHTSELQSR